MKKPTERAWRNVRTNGETKIPRRYVFIDTESRIQRVSGGHAQTWRLGAACYVTSQKGETRREKASEYLDPESMWKDVSAHCRKGSRTVLWAHNLGYDMRISDAIRYLLGLEWTLVAHNISARGTWMEWKRDGATLLMIDSTTIFATTIKRIGGWFGIGKVDMDIDDDDDDAWMRRCKTDVEILKTAICAYLDWIESDDLGTWQMTGSGQSWGTYRHKFLDCKMTSHADEDALKAERRAMWTGRCEAYWHGAINAQTVHEWDFTQAYARIARDYSVPIKLMGPMPDGYDWTRIVDSKSSALLAEVSVETELPVVPTYDDGRILWPTGRFNTTLWDVEIKAAIEDGAKITVKRGWLYRLRPALKTWAEWIIGLLESSDQECPAWRKSILKHWSRALIGRLAMTYNDWEEIGTAPESDIKSGQIYDADDGTLSRTMQIGHTIWIDNGRIESPNSMPMITGYIQAISRVRLWKVIRALPAHTLLYADTDSLLVTQKHSSLVAQVAADLTGGELRLKRLWDGFAIYGPRQIVTGAQVRASGVPTTARRTGSKTFAGEAWDSLSSSLRKGHSDMVVTRDREWTIAGIDRRRKGDTIGWTEPIRLAQT